MSYDVVDTKDLQLTVTGESTYCTFPSSISISFAFWQRSLTIGSGMTSHRFSCSICLDNAVSVYEDSAR